MLQDGAEFQVGPSMCQKVRTFLRWVWSENEVYPTSTGKIIEIDDKPLDRGVPYFQTNPYANVFSRL